MRFRSILLIAALLIASVAAGGRLLGRASRSNTAGVEQFSQLGDMRMTLRVDDATIGSRVIDVVFRDRADKPVDVNIVRLRFSVLSLSYLDG